MLSVLHLLSHQIRLAVGLAASSSASATPPNIPSVPDTEQALARQAANAIHAAFLDGVHRQQVKLPLSQAMYSEKEEGFVADRAIGWQGGPQETYRYLQPLAKTVLQHVAANMADLGGLVAKLREQILLDFDGSALLTAEHPAGALHDVQALLQPNTDDYYLDTIATIEQQIFSDTPEKPKRLFLLFNPAWRDMSSWGFFGAARAQRQVLDCYAITYALDQFVVRGTKVLLLRAYPADWAVFLAPMPYDETTSNTNNNDVNDDSSNNSAPRLIGTFEHRPEYDELDRLFLDSTAGIN